MMEFNKYEKELLSLINTPELTPDQITRMKDLICFLSEEKNSPRVTTKEEAKRLEYILYCRLL